MNLKVTSLDKLPFEKLTDKTARRYIYGEKSMIANFKLQAGAVVPTHHHINEQITYIIKGSIKATSEGKDYLVHAGEVIIFPPNVPHQVEALEDTLVFDVFTPPREDWIKGSDAYLKTPT